MKGVRGVFLQEITAATKAASLDDRERWGALAAIEQRRRELFDQRRQLELELAELTAIEEGHRAALQVQDLESLRGVEKLLPN